MCVGTNTQKKVVPTNANMFRNFRKLLCLFCEVLLIKRNHKKMLLQVNLLIAGAVCKLDDEV